MAKKPTRSVTPLTGKSKSGRAFKAPVVAEAAMQPDAMPVSSKLVAEVVQVMEEGEKEMQTVTHSGTPILNGVKAAGEAFVIPGASLLLDGNIKSGATHIAGAYVARALLGPIGWAYFAADSFSVSVSGKNLFDHFSGK